MKSFKRRSAVCFAALAAVGAACTSGADESLPTSTEGTAPTSAEVEKPERESTSTSSQPPATAVVTTIDAETSDSRPSTASSGGVVGPVVFGRDKDISQDALAAGTVELDEGCLVLDIGGGERSVVVWPYGTTWNDETQMVTFSDGGTVAVGDRVEFGGGFNDLSSLDWVVTDDQALAALERCVELSTTIVDVFVQ